MNINRSDHCVLSFPCKYTISCPPKVAETVRMRIMDGDLFDPDRSIGKRDRIYFPLMIRSFDQLDSFIRDIAAISSEIEIQRGEVNTGHRRSIPDPKRGVIGELEGIIPSDLMDLVPRSYERLGDSLILRIDSDLDSFKKQIALAFSHVLGSRFVLSDTSGVKGDLREPSMEVLLPPMDGNYEVTHKEGGVRYLLDPRKVMFSSGNVAERSTFPERVRNTKTPPRLTRAGKEGASDHPETVIDMFAGIGYFTIPLALDHDTDIVILAVEKNPVSFHYLEKNVMINGVEEVVHPVQGDNRSVIDKTIADRIIMGYLGGTLDFFDNALSISNPAGSIIHFHDTVETERGVRGMFRDLSRIAYEAGWDVSIISSHRVKSFAPRIDHIEMDLLITPSE